MKRWSRENLARKEILAFETLLNKGMSQLEIRETLGISKATYYRRLEELERLKQTSGRFR